jgi:hypothetical protein
VVEAINHDDPGEFMQAARQQMAGETLRRDAVRLVVAGRTTSTKPCASATSSRNKPAWPTLPTRHAMPAAS